jgi:Fe-Mn family superoxide dismutase
MITLQCQLEFQNKQDREIVLDLMRRFSSVMRYAYKRLLEDKKRKDLKKQLSNYKGYVAKYNEIQEKLASNFADRSKANQNYSEYRALKVEESFNYMGVILHELYFENLIGGGKGEPSEQLRKAIEEWFGSVDNCLNEIKATGIACRGWATLSYDLYNKMLFVNGFDAHNQYGFVGSIPLIVLDVYEHAYYVDQKK